MEFYDIFVAGNLGTLKVGATQACDRGRRCPLRVIPLTDVGSHGADVLVCGLQGSTHLNLPLSIFNDFDPEEIGEINLYQLFLMLTLFCVGLPERKAALW
jgi:hypothetical protein